MVAAAVSWSCGLRGGGGWGGVTWGGAPTCPPSPLGMVGGSAPPPPRPRLDRMFMGEPCRSATRRWRHKPLAAAGMVGWSKLVGAVRQQSRILGLACLSPSHRPPPPHPPFFFDTPPINSQPHNFSDRGEGGALTDGWQPPTRHPTAPP